MRYSLFLVDTQLISRKKILNKIKFHKIKYSNKQKVTERIEIRKKPRDVVHSNRFQTLHNEIRRKIHSNRIFNASKHKSRVAPLTTQYSYFESPTPYKNVVHWWNRDGLPQAYAHTIHYHWYKCNQWNETKLRNSCQRFQNQIFQAWFSLSETKDGSGRCGEGELTFPIQRTLKRSKLAYSARFLIITAMSFSRRFVLSRKYQWPVIKFYRSTAFSYDFSLLYGCACMSVYECVFVKRTLNCTYWSLDWNSDR